MENKELILKDLCGRLPYNTLVYAQNDNDWYESEICTQVISDLINEDYFIKPYLFPMSSITEEQEEELKNMYYSFNGMFQYTERIFDKIPFSKMKYFPYQIEEFFNKNHIDYRGLIRLGLAIDATNLNVYKDYV